MKKFMLSAVMTVIFIVSLGYVGCNEPASEKKNDTWADAIQGPNVLLSGSCLTDNPISTQNCWAYATVRMFQYKGQHCNLGYKQDINSMNNPCFTQVWSGNWNSDPQGFYNNVSVGDGVALGGAGNHIVFVVGKSGNSLSQIVVDDANRDLSGQIQHNTTLQAIKDWNSSYVPTNVWKYNISGSPCPLPPDAPALLSPANGITVGALGEYAFDWTQPWSPTSIVSYKFQVSTSPSFTPLVIDESSSSSDIAYIEFPYGGTTYYWQVNATNLNATSAWSQYRTLTVTSVINGITMPSAGSIYETNLDLEVQWSVNAPLSYTAKLEFSSNGGSTWTTLNSAVTYASGANGNTYMHQNPGVVSTNAKLRLTDNTWPSVSATSAAFISGPLVTVSGPSSRLQGQSGTWTASASPGGSYTYQWYRANFSTGMNNYSYVGTGPSYTGAPDTSSFNLRADAYLGSTKVGSGGIMVSCSNCGGIDP